MTYYQWKETCAAISWHVKLDKCRHNTLSVDHDDDDDGDGCERGNVTYDSYYDKQPAK
jgi:hypothetical protein